jgi:hypothetical protein
MRQTTQKLVIHLQSKLKSGGYQKILSLAAYLINVISKKSILYCAFMHPQHKQPADNFKPPHKRIN